MMTPKKLSEYGPIGRDAIASFLETVLGETVPVTIDGPTTIASDAIGEQFERCYAVLGRSRESEPFVVLADMEWLPFLSNAMLGDKLTEWNDEADDFLGEVASQVHASLQQTLAGTGVDLPDTNFTILPEVVALPSELLTNQLLEISAVLDTPEKHIQAHLLLPVTDEPQAPNTGEAESSPGTAEPASPSDAAPSSASGEPADQPGAARPKAGPAPASEIGAEPEDDSAVNVAFPSFPDFDEAPAPQAEPDQAEKFDLLGDVEIELAVELGRRRMPLQDILRLTNGSIVELDKLAGEPLQIYANNRLIAEGEAVVIDDQFGVRITRLASSNKRARALL